MRKAIIIVATLLVLAAVVAGLWLMPLKPRAGPWRLADGSELSLAGVTYGKNHAMRYGNGIADYLYPILSPALRKKFGCKVASIDTTDTNTMVLWFWEKGIQPLGSSSIASLHPNWHVVAVNLEGSESEVSFSSHLKVRWHGTNALVGWKLPRFPRRGKEIGIRIYADTDSEQPFAQFKIPNGGPKNYPVWIADSLPATVKTNDLEVTLTALVTGLTNVPGRTHIPFQAAKTVTRAEFEIRQRQQLSDNWTIREAIATAASGETSEPASAYESGRGWLTRRMPVFFAGTLWRDEPAWKVKLELWRTANFPKEELWTIKGVAIPSEGETSKLNITTNVSGSEIELVSLKATGKLDRSVSDATLIARSPLPTVGTYLRLVDIKDDQGRKVQSYGPGYEEFDDTGGRGATIRERNGYFELIFPGSAKSLDITLAYTKSMTVEFLARPTVAKENEKK